PVDDGTDQGIGPIAFSFASDYRTFLPHRPPATWAGVTQQLWSQAVQLDRVEHPGWVGLWRGGPRRAPANQHDARSKATVAGQHDQISKHAGRQAAQPSAETVARGGVMAGKTDGARQRHSKLDRLLDHPVEGVTAEQCVGFQAIGDEAQPAAVESALT